MAERSASLNFSLTSADDAKVVAGTGLQQHKPERFGRYVLLDRIGAGGMAEVFRAVMPGAQGFRQTFVVKRILAERSRGAAIAASTHASSEASRVSNSFSGSISVHGRPRARSAAPTSLLSRFERVSTMI